MGKICFNVHFAFYLTKGLWHNIRCCDLYEVSQCQDKLSEGLGLGSEEQAGGFTALNVEDEEELIRHCM